MSRADFQRTAEPQLVADVWMYETADDGRQSAALPGWGCPVFVSKNLKVGGWDALPLLRDDPLGPGERRNPEGIAMRRLLIAGSVMAGCACLPLGKAAAADRCNLVDAVYVDWKEVPEMSIARVGEARLKAAAEILGSRDLKQLTPQEAEDFEVSNGAFSYLVRGALRVADASDTQTNWEIAESGFRLEYSPSSKTIKIFALSTGMGRSKIVDVYLVVSSPVPIRKLFLRCYRMS